MATSSPLPAAQDLPTLRAKLQGLLRFLRQALSIANAHTVDFYTESVWAQLVDVPPETVLEVLRATATAEDGTSEARPPAEAEGGAGERRREGRAGRRRAGSAPRSAPSGGSRAESRGRGGGRGRGRGPPGGSRSGWGSG